MDESDLEAEEALARLGVDQLGAGGGKPVELGADVLDLVGDVMHARPALGEELPDRRLLAEWCEQLDATRSDEHRCSFDALVVHLRPVLELGPEELLVRVNGLVQVVNGNAEMMDAAGDHAAMLSAARAAKPV